MMIMYIILVYITQKWQAWRGSWSLALDYWAYITQESYLLVSIIILNASQQLGSIALGTDHYSDSESHTAGITCHQVNQLPWQWHLVKYLCADNADNMVKAIELLEKPRMPCTCALRDTKRARLPSHILTVARRAFSLSASRCPWGRRGQNRLH